MPYPLAAADHTSSAAQDMLAVLEEGPADLALDTFDQVMLVAFVDWDIVVDIAVGGHHKGAVLHLWEGVSVQQFTGC